MCVHLRRLLRTRFRRLARDAPAAAHHPHSVAAVAPAHPQRQPAEDLPLVLRALALTGRPRRLPGTRLRRRRLLRDPRRQRRAAEHGCQRSATSTPWDDAGSRHHVQSPASPGTPVTAPNADRSCVRSVREFNPRRGAVEPTFESLRVSLSRRQATVLQSTLLQQGLVRAEARRAERKRKRARLSTAPPLLAARRRRLQ